MAAIPRPASTVILMNENNHVFLTKRPETMKFLGGYFVFPGGSVDEMDTEFNSKVYKNVPRGIDFDLSFYVAAARELFEEAGILLVENDQLSDDAKEEYRGKLLNKEISLQAMLNKENSILDLDKLKYIGRRVTPETSAYRYDTRFFIATLPIGQYPIPDETEIAEAYWTSPKEALRSYEKGEILIAPPTKVSLQTIQSFLDGAGPLLLPDRLNESELRGKSK